MRQINLLTTLAFLLIGGCDTQQDIRIEQTRAQLIGTWREEADSDNDVEQRLLTLGSDGKFKVELQVVTSSASRERLELGGEWTFDGTHLKRRFLQENGRQFSGGKIRFATFPIQQVTESSFVMEDNIRKRLVKYHRVEGTVR